MRLKLLAVMAAGLAASPAFAQADPGAAPPDAAPAPVHHHHHHHHHAHATTASSGGEKPVDVGPNTPQANAAYQGGGVVLQGAPGAPAPRPQATPPGQTPANSVPP
jgi:hypothetical protein